jgi:hypothetical protein
VLWLVAILALVVALLAWRSALKTSRRLDQLTQMYWALRYQQAASRADGEPAQGAAAPPEAGTPPPPEGARRPADSFISLTSLKQKQEPD